MPPSRRCNLFAWTVLLASCGGAGSGSAACGITALAGATVLLDQFNVPRQTLSVAPATPPAFIPVRLAAGPALRGATTLGAEGWAVRVEGTPPPGSAPGFGVLVVDRDGQSRGVMVFSGLAVAGAPVIGTVSIAGADVPLLGLQTDIAGLETATCPFFPDSLRSP